MPLCPRRTQALLRRSSRTAGDAPEAHHPRSVHQPARAQHAGEPQRAKVAQQRERQKHARAQHPDHRAPGGDARRRARRPRQRRERVACLHRCDSFILAADSHTVSPSAENVSPVGRCDSVILAAVKRKVSSVSNSSSHRGAEPVCLVMQMLGSAPAVRTSAENVTPVCTDVKV